MSAPPVDTTQHLATIARRERAGRFAWLRSDWAAFAVRRLGGLVLSFALLVVVAFLIVPLIPGDPAVAMLGTNATPEAVTALRERLGLDEPLWAQFVHFLGNLLQGEFGSSFRYGVPVSEIIATKLPYTALLALGSIVVVLVVAIPLGMTVGVLTRGGRRGALGTVFGAVAGFLASFPAYVAGTLLVVVFAIVLRVLPAGGVDAPGFWVLPIASLALGPTFAVARVVRQETYTVLQQDFMRTARGRRLRAVRLYLVHALPNLMTSTLTLTGLILAGLIGGTIIIETVFSYPGLGLEVVQSIIYKDYPTIQGIILVIGALAILINLLIDIVLGAIDPRTLGGHHG
ncbi:ABC transporter permease [Leucobacter allii]|uniref:ABC transporter permease n=1 Tax=Leucobacter allii TaxID=2932247 RepID=A0ABY4FMF9_9MICO|nr:ABC transporter permease [Leucobacter allii]UOQ57470.1 ABC transporter permease [Leucobacter allii]UOR01927.1 ABC transporter permease [Leucobacter allii]